MPTSPTISQNGPNATARNLRCISSTCRRSFWPTGWPKPMHSLPSGLKAGTAGRRIVAGRNGPADRGGLAGLGAGLLHLE